MKSFAIKIARPACLSIIASAAEVYPKECMGSVCCPVSDQAHIVAAFPYQIARRKLAEVTSESPDVFDKLFNNGPFIKFGDFHSHPFQAFEEVYPLGPSETDLNDLKNGEIEIIVQVRRTRKNSNYWRNTKVGVSIAWDRYRFFIGAFMRTGGLDVEGVPLYKKVRLSFA